MRCVTGSERASNPAAVASQKEAPRRALVMKQVAGHVDAALAAAPMKFWNESLPWFLLGTDRALNWSMTAARTRPQSPTGASGGHLSWTATTSLAPSRPIRPRDPHPTLPATTTWTPEAAANRQSAHRLHLRGKPQAVTEQPTAPLNPRKPGAPPAEHHRPAVFSSGGFRTPAHRPRQHRRGRAAIRKPS
jgi:hypothetical protein